MKNNNIIQEELNRTKQLIGYNVGLTLYEQTGGGLPLCMGITAQGCPGTSSANVGMTTPTTKCAAIDNIPVTANDVGRDIMVGSIHMTVQTVFPNVTGNGSENVTSAPGPCPRPTGPGTGTGTTVCNNFTSELCDGTVNGIVIDISGNQTAAGHDGRCITVDGQPLGPQHVGTEVETYWMMSGPHQLFNFTITGLVPLNNPAPGNAVDLTTAPCPGTTTSTCNKTCQQLLPQFKSKAEGKPCNWLNNRLNTFAGRLNTATQGTCQYKRVECKIGVVEALIQQNGC